jgi:hypothetical protein
MSEGLETALMQLQLGGWGICAVLHLEEPNACLAR